VFKKSRITDLPEQKSDYS